MKGHVVHSLKTRLSIRVFLGMLVLSAAIVLGAYILTFEGAEQDARQQTGELLDAMEYSAAIALYASDARIADDVVRGVLRGSFVASVRLANDTGLDVKLAKAPDAPNQPIIARALKSPFDNNETLGQLQVALHPPAIHQRAAASARNMALALGGIVFFPTLLFWVAISRLVTTPLLKLSAQLAAIKPGDQQCLSLSGDRQDELAGLTQDINALLSAVSVSMRKERRLRQHVEALEKQYEAIFTQASTGILLLNPDGQCLIANPAVSLLFEDWRHAVDSVFSLLPNWEVQLFSEPDEFRALLVQAALTQIPQAMDLRLQRQNDEVREWMHLLVSCYPHPEHKLVAECLFIDISQRKQQEDEAVFQSHHDILTQLLNRRGLEARLNLNYAARENDTLSLLLLDLDRFKQINDRWGHLAGDRVLIEVAKRMKNLVRGADLLTRLGGDEFLICLRRSRSEPALHQFLLRLIESISADIEIEATTRDYVGASIGVVEYPRDGTDLVGLLHKADIALYEVKRLGRNGYCLYGDCGLSPVIIAREDTAE
ncbi:diguanylate cyclase domain-containing protein [Methylomonas sp. CM2]|uniref:diguanylate cyclase domain-containing protein n=1 Tax=Methylomonas sp. CM2 TaxID=3417647 RepID=UPI003CF21D48